MRSKIREKIFAAIMLSAFVLTNSFTAGLAVSDGYNGYGDGPILRGNEVPAVGLRSGVGIPNGDSVVNLSLRDADIKQVLRMFADQAGMNIIFTPEVEGQVTMDLVDIPLQDALGLVVKTNKLFYDIKANTIVISTEEAALALTERNEKLSIVPVKYVNAAGLAHFMNESIFSKKKGAINPGISTGAIVATNPATNELIVNGTDKDLAIVRNIVEQFDRKPAITTFKVNHVTPAEMANSICNSLLPSMSITTTDGSSSGGSSGSSSSGGSSSGGAAGIPTGFASDSSGSSSSSSSSGSSSSGSNIAVGGGELACAMSIQNSASESENDEDTSKLTSLPFMNLSVSYYPTLGTIQLVGGSETQIDMIREYIAANDKKTPQAYLEVQVISLNESGSKEFNNNWQFMSKNFSFNAGDGRFGTNSMYPVFFAGHGYTIVDPSSFDKETGEYEAIGKVTKWGSSPTLTYSMNYILENNKGRVLASPKILLTSGQQSVIDLTSDYVSKVTSQYLDNGSASGSAQVQREYEIGDDNGIKIEITPFISPDGYVTLDIHPEYRTIASTITQPGAVSGERDVVATLLQRRDLDLKGVRVKDGETLVIGGMINESETKAVSKIPFLGDLPVVGMFFRSTSTRKSKEEMVIMMTPQIIVDTEDAVADDNML